jgi:hypothetical protein
LACGPYFTPYFTPSLTTFFETGGIQVTDTPVLEFWRLLRPCAFLAVEQYGEIGRIAGGLLQLVVLVGLRDDQCDGPDGGL